MNNKNFSILKTFFPNGTAEEEREILKQVFIAPSQLPEVVTAPPGSARIIVGNKGVGKTAVIERTYSANLDQGVPTVLLHPDDFDLSKVANAGDIATLKRTFFQALVEALAVQIGRKLSGLLSGPAAELHKIAVKKGAKSADRIEKTLELLTTLAKSQTNIDIAGLARALSGGVGDNADLLGLLKRYASERPSLFVLLVDDTDQVAAPEEPNHLNRIWALLLAIRKLANDLPTLECLVTLRTEVWMRLQRDERGQRDQIDHIRPLVRYLRSEDQHLNRILERRLAAAANLVGSQKLWEPFFESEEVTLPSSKETRSWRSFLLKSSRERPRDLIQLVGEIIDVADRRKRKLIGSEDAEIAMHTYSKDRLSDLAIEVGRDCPNFKEVVSTLAQVGHGFECSFEELRKHLASLPSRFGVVIRGRTLPPNDDASVLPLLAILHEAGVLNPRVADSRESRGFRHINFSDEPHLVTQARWNDLQAMTWEVHPAFRTYLSDVDAAKSAGGR